MAKDINVGKLKRNAFRVSKHRGETASRVRMPGGYIDAESMKRISEIAEKYGNGSIFLTNRQGVEIPGIKLEDMDAVNKEIQLVIDNVKTKELVRSNLGVTILPESYAKSNSDEGIVYFHIPKKYRAFWRLCVAYDRDKFMSKADRAFFDLLM